MVNPRCGDIRDMARLREPDVVPRHPRRDLGQTLGRIVECGGVANSELARWYLSDTRITRRARDVTAWRGRTRETLDYGFCVLWD